MNEESGAAMKAAPESLYCNSIYICPDQGLLKDAFFLEVLLGTWM
jgi:hypothetical protein